MKPSGSSRSKVALIMAAGTGGHVFPALAVARALVAQGYVIHWLGTPYGMEQNLVPAAGYPLHAVNIRGLRGKGIKGLMMAPWRIALATWQSRAVIRAIKADIVVGFGGYIAGPGGVAARLAGVPLVIHEQNAIAGMTNRWLNRIAHLSLQAFPGALAGAMTVGNPVRRELVELPARAVPLSGPLNILVVGGSLGASALNDAVLACWQAMPAAGRPNLRHQVGKRDAERMLAAYAASDVVADVSAFIDDMEAAYGWADLMICRSGALTVSEVAAVGKAAIFVPFPYAVDDHQTINAGYLANNQAALICQQKDLTPEWLQQTIGLLDKDRARLQGMADQSHAQARPDATALAVEQIMRKTRD
ncbi:MULTISPECIES: undecaprenyldiphospho-muramoylpentapeptide beta-N-acetylglucosaminyltransferase [unclassified Oceanobacter]|uniref:undecaprenyldiphospho-muramoylpentapeptide beta-N-acetylglucosaminyltransferase n=2 Tax=Gammaproteobacteria TaxID=1236 RepID=UPI00273440F0|nr:MULTISPECIES: undecaprenyldiphospho-muramoylpentapeptide beta-N-acetylglucosaminyltransferase [unclassified Oceanobacter]MDP2609963.1 undecaprenyldiphospho-muramoylpentapeptide beta-N-acetylglucosaminyltransferase [Oceanobacter sp. 1_MG-2023]MDP2613233.1 undecaprenyldiphospho-muramoylpentapeptide beta-N-acetylglucosaminyltransferase [Oceanobacter sp. 2_MG-2023]